MVRFFRLFPGLFACLLPRLHVLLLVLVLLLFHGRPLLIGTPHSTGGSDGSRDESVVDFDESFTSNLAVHLVTKSRAGIQVPNTRWTSPPPLSRLGMSRCGSESSGHRNIAGIAIVCG